MIITFQDLVDNGRFFFKRVFLKQNRKTSKTEGLKKKNKRIWKNGSQIKTFPETHMDKGFASLQLAGKDFIL